MVPSKADELATLCSALRQQGILHFALAPGRNGAPDLFVVSAQPVAVWLRRAELARPLTDCQKDQISRVEAQGWTALVAYGARKALRELRRMGGRYAQCG